MNPINKIYKTLGTAILFLVLILTANQASAQYCTSNATNAADEDIARVTLQGNSILLDNMTNVYPGVNCQLYSDHTALQPPDLSAGGKYTITITSTSCGGTFTHRTLAWIDYNQNYTFESSEAVAPTATTSSGTPTVFTYNFTVPCNIKPGNTRMRVVLIEGAVNNPASACGTYTWGETEDYTVSLALPSTLSAGFIAPNSAWVKSVVKFVNSNPSGYISHTWDANNDGSIEAANSVNFNYTWNSAGNQCVKLKSTNCLGSDSVVKCLTVNAPTAIPVANFVSDKVIVEQYMTARFYDLSTNGPWKWEWKVYDSSDVNDVKDLNSGDVISDPGGNGATEFTSSPEFSFERPGCYTVELVSTNDVGNSLPKVKKCYITVIMPTQYLLGFGSYGPNNDNIVESATGSIFDNGGLNGNYGNNQGLGTRSFLQITPCNAKKITLTMTTLKFNGIGDKLRVWDGKSPGGPNTTLLATWSSTTKAPQTVIATSGSMYILFESDNTGVDSGYAGYYTSELAPATVPTPSFSLSSDPLYNSAPAKFTNTTLNVVGVPGWEWTIDNSVITPDRNMWFQFPSDGQYNVCLEIKSCAGNSKTCKLVDVVTPNTQTKLDVIASNRRPAVSTDIVTLCPVRDNANRFEWTIFPTTYVLVNPPSSPSTYGPGSIRYNSNPGDSVPCPQIRFTAPGCYTIALKAYNSLDPTNTTKTVVKNNFICAVDFCDPSAFILAADLGINNVKVLDGNTELINFSSGSGVSAYTDYSGLATANLTFGKTYTFEVSRNTNADPANRKAWIDWNIDGDFNDQGEEIFVESSTYAKTGTVSFTVPNINDAFEGKTKLRVGINFDNENTDPCGPAIAGEYEDYGIFLYNDNIRPVITITGNDTIYLEVGSTYKDAGATARDDSEGDISNLVVSSNNLDTSLTGLYTFEYNVTDNSGNMAIPAVRTIIVVNDLTPPVLILNPSAPGCIEARRDNQPYVDPGATAYNTNPLTDLTSAIIVVSNVDTRKEGNYKVKYSVLDFAGNLTTAERNVCVEDNTAPEIKVISDTIIQIGSVWINQVTAEDAYDLSPVLMRSWSPEPVNTTVKGVYTATYIAEDMSGNISAPMIVRYRVNDYVPPVINLNTFDVVEHDVITPYNSVNPSVTDNYYGPGQVSVMMISSNVNPNEIGTYSEVFKAVDGSNNITFKTRTVKVIDRFAPVIWGGTIYGCVGENIWPMWDLTTTDNYYGPDQLLPRVEIIQQNVNPWESGNYFITYRVTDPSGNTSAPLTRQVIYTYWPRCYNSTVSIDQQKAADETVSVYPNPSSGLVNIDLKGVMAENVNIEVYNQVGQLVYSATYNESKGLFEIDLRDQASGVYTIKLISDGQVISKRVVIQ